MLEGALWWKRLSKLSMQIGAGRGEVQLHPRSKSSGGREGGFRETEEMIIKPEWPLEPPVSVLVAVLKNNIKCPLSDLNEVNSLHLNQFGIQDMFHVNLCI